MTDDDLRKLWREAGGSFHGPRVETGTMPEAALLSFLRGIFGKVALAEAQASGAMSMLKDVRDDCVAARLLARRLSDALLTVRPLGGSELFMRLGDEFWADPDVCASEIKRLRDDAIEAKLSKARATADLARFQDQTWASFAMWSEALGWGLTGIQPECHAAMDASVAELVRLRGENTALREALEPFARVAEVDIGSDETDADIFQQPGVHHRAPRITVGDMRRAVAVTRSSEEPRDA